MSRGPDATFARVGRLTQSSELDTCDEVVGWYVYDYELLKIITVVGIFFFLVWRDCIV